MRSFPRLALARLSTLTFIAISSAGCALTPRPPVTPDVIRCAELIPDRYRQPVKGTAIPGPTVGEISAALDSQTSKLDQANGRTSDVVAIVDVCDRHNTAAIDKIRPRKRILGIF